MQFYCVKCRKKVEVAKFVKKKYGKRNAVQGKCGKCGTTVTRFVAA